MERTQLFSPSTLARDLTAGVAVFLVALPLCLGVARASGAEPFAGVLAGIVGGILVGLLSGSQTSVTGPSPGPVVIIAATIASLGSFEAFLLAVIVAGVLQIALGVARAGFIAAFFPSSVVKGLLAAIGVLLILKQIPHVLGHNADPEGEMNFLQPDHENTFTELIQTVRDVVREVVGDLHPGAAVIGIASIIILVLWERNSRLKKSVVPAPLIVVLVGVGLGMLFERIGGRWVIEESHLVQLPVAKSFSEFRQFLKAPDFSQWANPAIYTAGLTIAVVASLETLLNLEAVDKLDPKQRSSPASRELLAQGIGNVVVGLIGGIPITSVIVRGSVNINAGAQTKLSAIVHGVLLFACVMLLPTALNMIPVSCLGAILLVTGVKLSSPKLIKQMWNEGRYQFIPFAVTLVSIVLTDLVVGVLIGLAVSVSFILNSNLRRPMRRIVEKHLGGEVLHIELANQVSFLNRAALEKTLRAAPRGTHVLLDAQKTDYIDPDILSLIREFKERIAPAHGVEVSLRGFRAKYDLRDEIQYVDYSTRELQSKLTPPQVVQILREGNERFRTSHRLTRDLDRQLDATAKGQHPIAVVLSCIDSRAPTELILDLGLGDVFSVRMAGNVTSPKVLGSLEYGCAVAGAKLILVMGHTRCGAVGAAVDLAHSSQSPQEATGCDHLEPIVVDIQQSIDASARERMKHATLDERSKIVDAVARNNVLRVVRKIVDESQTVGRLVRERRVAVLGAVYDIATGKIDFMTDEAIGL